MIFNKVSGIMDVTENKMLFLKKLFGTAQERKVKRFYSIVEQIKKIETRYQELTDDELRAKTDEFKKRFEQGESLDALLPEAFAVVKNVCRRLCGQEVDVFGYQQKWDMVPYDVQLVGAIALHQGHIAEMQTGEGKTLTATLPLYLNALTGKPVHLVTVNDYLAGRDCQWTGSILRWLGLKTSILTNDTPMHQRKECYEADVVYGTASEFGFDYLRDNSMASSAEQQVQRGYYFAMVDEIDSILIDEARTPLIISGPVGQSTQMYDTLKEPVARLVKAQEELCAQIAKKTLQSLKPYLADESVMIPKDHPEVKKASHDLWLLSKGMPQNKILRKAKEHPDIRSMIDRWDLHYHLDQNKEEKGKALGTLLIIVDEKSNDFELTDKGIQAWASLEGGSSEDFLMLDLSEAYDLIEKDSTLSEKEKIEYKLKLNQEDGIRKERAHNTRQLLKAFLTMENDVDYIIEDDKIVIIDENTGRPQPGRRFSDGLHQAIEAKESVAIQKETQTYATITLQNYFRMYDKIAGMTGTAITEAHEFKEIYKIDVLQIPTYKPSARKDYNDEIYMTEREKLQALLKEIKEVHEAGRPILIGTDSVDSSEKVSRMLKQHKIPHTVLNAKNHAQEAEIIADAGKPKAITVATNMAGRGTDIKLQGEVPELGGLHVIGTTRHESRRIDRQLIGRSGRLGDKGSSKFYISFEDHLMRLFASPKLTAMLQRFRPPEGEAISAKLLNRSIETAQKRVEGRNYMVRKYTLDYDDVMNRQRQEVYKFRNEILHTDSMEDLVLDLFDQACQALAEKHFNPEDHHPWNAEGFRHDLMQHFPVHFEESYFDQDHLVTQELSSDAAKHLLEALKRQIELEVQDETTDPQEISEIFADAARMFILDKIDTLWQQHLLEMDHLRSEVNLRTVAQKDPLLEFKHEAFVMFERFRETLYTESCAKLFQIKFAPKKPTGLDELLQSMQFQTNTSLFSDPMAPPAEVFKKSPPPALKISKVGRNDLCPCQSGKKYKKCCGQHLDSV